MTLATEVLHPHLPGHILLRPGFTLDQITIDRMRELRISSVWIRYPALSEIVKYPSSAFVQGHAKLVQTLADSIDPAAGAVSARLEFTHYATAVRALFSQLRTEPHAAALIQDLADKSPSLARHGGAVCLLSLLMGLKLQDHIASKRKHMASSQARGLENLGLGALLHDVGEMRIPESLRTLHPDDALAAGAMWRTHTEIGFRMVHGQVEATAAAVVLHHHQRHDGSGFPSITHPDGQDHPPAGEEVHIFARIAAVADRFDELRCRAPSSCTLADRRMCIAPAVAVLSRIVHEARAGLLDPAAVRALLHVVPAFAPGSIVTLDDDRPALVFSSDPLNPCRPIVRVIRRMDLLGKDDDDALGDEIDLSQVRSRHIRQCDGHDVQLHLFNPRSHEEFQLHLGAARPFNAAA